LIGVTKARGLTTPRSSKHLFPDSADPIVAEIELSERWTQRKHSCKILCTLSFHFTARQLESGDVSPFCYHPAMI
jgi:hypothetical protein